MYLSWHPNQCFLFLALSCQSGRHDIHIWMKELAKISRELLSHVNRLVMHICGGYWVLGRTDVTLATAVGTAEFHQHRMQQPVQKFKEMSNKQAAYARDFNRYMTWIGGLVCFLCKLDPRVVGPAGWKSAQVTDGLAMFVSRWSHLGSGGEATYEVSRCTWSYKNL